MTKMCSQRFIMTDAPRIAISAFYKFVTVDDCEGLRKLLLNQCRDAGIKGTILIAPEGINATISGEGETIPRFVAWLREDARFQDLATKDFFADTHPFRRLKVKVKPEILTFGVPAANPALNAGAYVSPENWNGLVADPGVVVIDTRNAYEVGVGTFPGALDPGTRTFCQFPEFVEKTLDPQKHKKIAMFCTGGIRCEKASAYLLGLGFPEVYHLQGGILKYLEEVPREQSLWRGECFVFDERVAIEHGLEQGTHALCPACGQPMPQEGTDAGGAHVCDKHLVR